MSFYNELLEKHGYQGWWPINSRYHPRDYSFPRNEKERFEIIVGAVLTQNTSWRNVERALSNLRRENLLSPKLLLASDEEKLAEVIRSAGYFRQKAKKLKFISKFYLSLPSRASGLRRRFKSEGEFRHALLQT
ncbi:endonuclease III domain-containing protein, partial [Candidatus Pacearchaeota archaeon]